MKDFKCKQESPSLKCWVYMNLYLMIVFYDEQLISNTWVFDEHFMNHANTCSTWSFKCSRYLTNNGLTCRWDCTKDSVLKQEQKDQEKLKRHAPVDNSSAAYRQTTDRKHQVLNIAICRQILVDCRQLPTEPFPEVQRSVKCKSVSSCRQMI